MEQFQRRKSQTLASISSAIPDKSPKGFLDVPIVPLIDAINRHSSFFTTSSCSGRISVLSHPSPKPNPISTEKKKKKAGGGGWVFVTHEPADPEEVVESVFGRSHENGDEGLLVFRFEPLIIAVECLDVEAAKMMVAAAVSCGFRESGITSIHRRVIVAIRCSIRLEVPLGQVGSIMVSQEYVRYLVGIANEKMEANRKRTDGLLHVLQSKVLSGSAKQMIIDEKNEGCRIDKGSSLHFEAKQIGSLSNTKPSEIDASDSHNLNHTVDHLKDSCHSAFGSLSDEDKQFESSSRDLNLLYELEAGYNNEEPRPANLSGTHGKSERSISVDILVTVGEPNEKLFLWGQSACTLNYREPKQIIVFGGFGGVGRHARSNYSLMLDPQTGHLNEIDARGPPSPRLGHTASMVGDQVFIIGGRCGPSEILNEVWALDMSENRWMFLQCTGNMFQPRHRHAAAVVGSNIYVLGGLNGEVILSCMTVLNTDTSQWSEVSVKGDLPSARHSHSLIANDSLLYMFGGYDGEKTLGDLYSFDVRTCLWNKEKTSGRAPFPRFSHCMFIYKNYIGILGGCPVRQQNQELSLLNLEHKIWIHVTINSLGRDIWVRSSACVIDDDLVIIGGGTSCYAFGTKFNQPMKLNLQLIDSLYGMTFAKENEPPADLYKAVSNISHSDKYLLDASHSSNSNHRIDIAAAGNGNYINAKCSVLQVKKKYAKFVKDLLKQFGWLDRSRKAQPSQDDHHVQLPVSRSFYSFYQIECLNLVATEADFCQHQLGMSSKGLALNDVSLPMALKFLSSCGVSLQSNDVSCNKKVSKAPKKIMKELICTLLRKKGMPPMLLEQLPTRWERIGDITVLPVNSFKDPIWDSIGDELWQAVAKSLGAQRLARQGRILPTGMRDSTLEILVGDGGWVTHQENGIMYSFDPTKCMFSSGNHSEKLRMARLDCRKEVVVDLFAGIGYFVLPFLVKAKAKLVYACEWNPHAIKALQHNIQANFVADRCIILEGDNRVTTPKGVANRVCLGLLPSSESSWATAIKALRPEGGVLHVHENVKDSEENSWSEYALKSISSIAQSEGLCWEVTIQHLERVKWYGPHIRHVVADISCRQLQT